MNFLIEEKNEIPFNFSYYALDLLGKGLYSNRWSAISELIANGIDAGATNVYLYMNLIEKNKATIEIIDNGTGMTYEDLVSKYVFIGRNKREEDYSKVDPKKLMGRKGIGKLAALNLSKKYYLCSKSLGKISTWCLDATNTKKDDVPKLVRVNENIEFDCKNIWKNIDAGTIIKLTNVDMSGFGVKSLEGLKKRLADFYLVNQMECQINVACVTNYDEANKIRFTPVQKEIAFKNFFAFFDNTGKEEFKEVINNEVNFPSSIPDVANKKRKVTYFNKDNFPKIEGRKRFKLPNGQMSEKEYEYELKGWIGIHTTTKAEEAQKNDSRFVRNGVYIPNRLRLYIRNKLIVEDFMSQYVRSTQATSGYIEGEISFDILDNNDLEDITTSDRQGFTEIDERVELLIEILRPIINTLIKLRNEEGKKVRNEESEYRRAKEKRLEDKVEKEKKKRDVIEKKSRQLSMKLNASKKRLYSEKKRNVFLMSTLTEDGTVFSERKHTININLDSIKSGITILINELKKPNPSIEKIRKKLGVILQTIGKIQAIISYVEKANFSLDNEFIKGDILEFIREYVVEIESEAFGDIKVSWVNDHDYSLNCEFSPQDIAIIIDNIFSNSLKYGAKKMDIVVTNSDQEGWLCIKFIDNGKGIPSEVENIDELFEFGKSYSIETSSGVGLYHIKEIVEKNLGGKVFIENSGGFTLGVKLRHES